MDANLKLKAEQLAGEIASEAKTLEDAAIFQDSAVSVSPNEDRPEILGGVTSSPNLLRVLGVQPFMGRDFVAADAVAARWPAALASRGRRAPARPASRACRGASADACRGGWRRCSRRHAPALRHGPAGS